MIPSEFSASLSPSLKMSTNDVTVTAPHLFIFRFIDPSVKHQTGSLSSHPELKTINQAINQTVDGQEINQQLVHYDRSDL